jgi:AcrR family transcriptional regulator
VPHAATPTVPPEGGGPRAPRMAPEDRREMLIAATTPLVARHGPQVTTRQIAEAAGVAEGTIFRVFPDKDALVRAALARAIDADPVLADLAAIDMRLPLRFRMLAVVAILQQRLRTVFSLMTTVGAHAPAEVVAEHRAAARSRHAMIMERVARILEPDRERLRWPVPEVARVLWLLTFSASHPLIAEGQPLTADEITDVVLDGTLLRPGADPADHEWELPPC